MLKNILLFLVAAIVSLVTGWFLNHVVYNLVGSYPNQNCLPGSGMQDCGTTLQGWPFPDNVTTIGGARDPAMFVNWLFWSTVVLVLVVILYLIWKSFQTDKAFIEVEEAIDPRRR